MDFSEALKHLKQGGCLSRERWDNKEQYVCLVNPDISNFSSYFAKTVQGKFVPWLVTQADLFANDWIVVNNNPTISTLEEFIKSSLTCGFDFTIRYIGHSIDDDMQINIFNNGKPDASMEFKVNQNSLKSIDM